MIAVQGQGYGIAVSYGGTPFFCASGLEPLALLTLCLADNKTIGDFFRRGV